MTALAPFHLKRQERERGAITTSLVVRERFIAPLHKEPLTSLPKLKVFLVRALTSVLNSSVELSSAVNKRQYANVSPSSNLRAVVAHNENC